LAATVIPLVGPKLDIYVLKTYGHFDKFPQAPKGFLYHGTSKKNLASIKSKGIIPTDKSADGTLACYGAQKFSTASVWSSITDGVMLRFRMGTQIWTATDNKVFYSYSTVPPSHIEILTNDGWKSMND